MILHGVGYCVKYLPARFSDFLSTGSRRVGSGRGGGLGVSIEQGGVLGFIVGGVKASLGAGVRFGVKVRFLGVGVRGLSSGFRRSNVAGEQGMTPGAAFARPRRL